MMPTLNTMTAPLQRLWLRRSPQERKQISVVAMLLLASLYGWLVYSGAQASTTLRNSLPDLRMQAQVMEQQALELERLRTLPVTAVSDTALLPVMELTIANAGLTALLTSIEAQGADQVVAVYGSIPFSVWLDWVSVLGVQGIRVEHVNIETLSAPGMVSVTATLIRTRSQ